MRIFAIIPSGGKGTRSGYNIPKQYLKINGKELIAYTLEVFQKNRSVDEIILSADPFYFKLLEKIKRKYSFSKLTGWVEAGKERQALQLPQLHADHFYHRRSNHPGR